MNPWADINLNLKGLTLLHDLVVVDIVTIHTQRFTLLVVFQMYIGIKYYSYHKWRNDNNLMNTVE